MEEKDSELTQATIALANATVILSKAIAAMQQALERQAEGICVANP